MLHSLAGIQSFRSSTKVFLIPATPKRIVFVLVTGLELAPGSLDGLASRLPPNLILNFLADLPKFQRRPVLASNSLNSSSSGHY